MPGRSGSKATLSFTPSRAADTSVHVKLNLILQILDSFNTRITKVEF